ncbi:MAG: hypothetical protein ACXVRG_04825 [Gaiellaceae bacterium]
MPLGQEVALDPLEPADHLVGQAADLGEVPSDRLDLLAQAVLESAVDLRRERRLELRGGEAELLDLGPRPLERGVDGGRVSAAFGGLLEPFPRPLDRVVGHRRQR